MQRFTTVLLTILWAAFFVPAVTAQAKPSRYAPVVQLFDNDRYKAIAQAPSARDLTNAVRCFPVCVRGNAKAGKHTKRSRKHRNHPIAGTVDRLSVWGGVRREFKEARTGGRPARWCGWWLGHHLGMPRRDLWVARNWARVGVSAGGPRIGAIVVWPHHVGIITGRVGSKWVVKSGNDGHAVRERPRSLARAIAFRTLSGRA